MSSSRETRQISIANRAARMIGSSTWARDMYKMSIDGEFIFESGKRTSSLFVYDVIYEVVGTAPRNSQGPLTPEEWASSMIIENWEYKGTGESWQPGDVIAIKIGNSKSDTTGKCGIAVSSSEVIAVDTLRVTQGNHGLTGGTVRRYTGDSNSA